MHHKGLDARGKALQSQPASKCQEPVLEHSVNLGKPDQIVLRKVCVCACARFEETFFLYLKTQNPSLFPLSCPHHFLSLLPPPPLSLLYLFLMPVANASGFPFYKSAQYSFICTRLTTFLFKWLMLNQSQMWRSERRGLVHCGLTASVLTWQTPQQQRGPGRPKSCSKPN